MTKPFIKSGYHITTDSSFQNKRYGIPPELDKQLELLAVNCQTDKSPKMIERLHQLIEKYPRVPQLKNYLSVAFHTQGNYEKAVEVNDWTLKEHPDYLFARINMAHDCIAKGEVQKVPSLLGHDLELKRLYPEREVFHLTEVTSYLKTVIRYMVAIDNIELAENRLALLKEIAPEHHDTDEAEVYLWPSRLKKSAERFKEENENRIKPVVNKVMPQNSSHASPSFHHPQIHNLYQHDLHIPHEMLSEILALPRHTLVNDLERVLQDAVERYVYFKNQEFKEETRWMVLHAFFLLKELKAAESLNAVLSFLENDDDFLTYWLGDHITITLWQCLYSLGFSNTTQVKKFLQQPGVSTYSKSSASQALCQMVLHHPEKREEVLRIYEETFDCFVHAKEDDNLIDSDFLGLTICDVLDCQLHELLPVVKRPGSEATL